MLRCSQQQFNIFCVGLYCQLNMQKARFLYEPYGLEFMTMNIFCH
jgi:hypothetical protein